MCLSTLNDYALRMPSSMSLATGIRSSRLLETLRFIHRTAKTIAEKEGVSRPAQFAQMGFLYLTRRLGPMLYYEARIWSKHYSMKQKMRFMNSGQYRRRVAELNPTRYQKFSQHKLAEKAILTLLGVPTPKFLGFFHPQEGCTAGFAPLTTPEELALMLRALPSKKICFKLVEGWGGAGFVAAEVHRTSTTIELRNPATGDAPCTIGEFVTRYLNCTHGMLIEEYLQQHEVMRALNPTSVNTLRIWVKQNESGVELLGVIARIGRAGAVVDNAGQGGFIVQVDSRTGVLGDVLTPGILPQRSTQHPDSGLRLTGIQIPHWEECIALAKRSLLVFPQARFTGLDLAISSEGPVIIELNLEPDKVTARNFGKPLADLLA